MNVTLKDLLSFLLENLKVKSFEGISPCESPPWSGTPWVNSFLQATCKQRNDHYSLF